MCSPWLFLPSHMEQNLSIPAPQQKMFAVIGTEVQRDISRGSNVIHYLNCSVRILNISLGVLCHSLCCRFKQDTFFKQLHKLTYCTVCLHWSRWPTNGFSHFYHTKNWCSFCGLPRIQIEPFVVNYERLWIQGWYFSLNTKSLCHHCRKMERGQSVPLPGYKHENRQYVYRLFKITILE